MAVVASDTAGLGLQQGAEQTLQELENHDPRQNRVGTKDVRRTDASKMPFSTDSSLIVTSTPTAVTKKLHLVCHSDKPALRRSSPLLFISSWFFRGSALTSLSQENCRLTLRISDASARASCSLPVDM